MQKRNSIIVTFFLFLFFGAFLKLKAQNEWEKTIKVAQFNDAHLIKQHSDGTIWLCGSYSDGKSAVSDSLFLAKIDAKGNTEKVTKTAGSYNPLYLNTFPNGEVLLVSDTTFLSDNQQITLSKYDVNLKKNWQKTLSSDDYFFNYNFKMLSDGKIVCLHGKQATATVFNADGTIASDQKISNQNIINTFLQSADDDKLTYTAFHNDSLVEYQASYTGQAIAKKLIAKMDSTFFEKVLKSKDEAYIVLHDGLLTCFKKEKKIWEINIEQSIKGNYFFRVYDVMIDEKGNVVVAGVEALGSLSNENTSAVILVIDKNGVLLSNKRFGGTAGHDFSAITQSIDGDYLACGWQYATINVTNKQVNAVSLAKIVKTKAADLTNLIYGKVIVDVDKNCKKDSLEIFLKSVITIAKHQSKGTFYGTTDQNGNYQILVDTGTYKMSVAPPSPYHQDNCVLPNVNFTTQNQAKLHDFLLQTNTNCPFLTVDLATNAIKFCQSSTYTVNYCNKGSENAQNAFIDLDLDANLIFENSTIPNTLQGNNKLRFNLGTVKKDTCYQFAFNAKTACSGSLFGKTLCNNVHIYPDTLCQGSKNYIKVKAICKGQLVDFEISNVGDLAMSTPKNYLVIEDDLMAKTASFQLGANALQTISIAAKAGKTYRLIAEQTNPLYGIIATDATENCNASNPFSTDFINQFALGDDSPFEDKDCRLVVDAPSVNDKQAFPIGLKNEHFIPKNTAIEYLIRFKNTNNSVISKVEIQDTISNFLAIESIEIGASSHNYNYNISGKGILQVNFDDVKLQPAASGFVKFRIQQKTNNPNGVVINNNAAIIFDNQQVVISNFSKHTVGESWLKLTPSHETQLPDVGLKVYPNPFQDVVHIELEKEYDNLIFALYDISGRLIRHEKFEKQHLDFQRDGLQNGFYFYQIKSHQQIIATGKLSIQ